MGAACIAGWEGKSEGVRKLGGKGGWVESGVVGHFKLIMFFSLRER